MIQYFATGETIYAMDICTATETRDGGATDGDQCTFPFEYNGVRYSECQPMQVLSPNVLEQHRDKLWCATGDGRSVRSVGRSVAMYVLLVIGC